MSTGTRSSWCIALDPAAKVEIPSDVEGRTGAAIDGGESLFGVAPLSNLRVLIPSTTRLNSLSSLCLSIVNVEDWKRESETFLTASVSSCRKERRASNVFPDLTVFNRDP